MPLDIKQTLDEIRGLYKNNARTSTYNALIYGPMGSGKTNLLKTCRLPVLVHSFDPGGSTTIRDEVAAGKIIVDNRYEVDNVKFPHVAADWDKEYDRLKRGGIFEQLGTFAIDSGTTFSQAFMNAVLAKANRAGGTPQQNDYLPTMVMLENAIKDMTALPCDFIMLCHEDTDKDEATGRMFVGPAFIGKLKYRIPILFDEIYFASATETSSGPNYKLLTRTTGLYKARTRLGRGGLFETYEEQDIKRLLKKAGYSTEDKPY